MRWLLLTGHARPGRSRFARARRRYLDRWPARPRASGERRRQALTLVAFGARGRRLPRRRRSRCAPAGRRACSVGRHRQGGRPPSVSSCAASAGPRPPARPPPAASCALARSSGGRGGTWWRAVHDRPRFDALRDLRPGEGGRPAARLHGRARLSAAAALRERGDGCTSDGASRRGPRQHRPRRRPLPA